MSKQEYRIIEKVGSKVWRVQSRSRFLCFSWWTTHCQFDMYCTWPETFDSYDQAQKCIEKLKKLDKYFATPWTVVK